MLGTVLQQQGDRDGRARAVPEAIRLQPDSAEAHLSLGQVLQQKGDRAGAAAALAEAERLNRKKADAQAAAFALSAGREQLKSGDARGPRSPASARRCVSRPRTRRRTTSSRCALRAHRARAPRRARHFAEARRLAPYLPAGPRQ